MDLVPSDFRGAWRDLALMLRHPSLLRLRGNQLLSMFLSDGHPSFRMNVTEKASLLHELKEMSLEDNSVDDQQPLKYFRPPTCTIIPLLINDLLRDTETKRLFYENFLLLHMKETLYCVHIMYRGNALKIQQYLEKAMRVLLSLDTVFVPHPVVPATSRFSVCDTKQGGCVLFCDTDIYVTLRAYLFCMERTECNITVSSVPQLFSLFTQCPRIALNKDVQQSLVFGSFYRWLFSGNHYSFVRKVKRYMFHYHRFYTFLGLFSKSDIEKSLLSEDRQGSFTSCLSVFFLCFHKLRWTDERGLSLLMSLKPYYPENEKVFQRFSGTLVDHEVIVTYRVGGSTKLVPLSMALCLILTEPSHEHLDSLRQAIFRCLSTESEDHKLVSFGQPSVELRLQGLHLSHLVLTEPFNNNQDSRAYSFRDVKLLEFMQAAEHRFALNRKINTLCVFDVDDIVTAPVEWDLPVHWDMRNRILSTYKHSLVLPCSDHYTGGKDGQIPDLYKAHRTLDCNKITQFENLTPEELFLSETLLGHKVREIEAEALSIECNAYQDDREAGEMSPGDLEDLLESIGDARR